MSKLLQIDGNKFFRNNTRERLAEVLKLAKDNSYTDVIIYNNDKPERKTIDKAIEEYSSTHKEGK